MVSFLVTGANRGIGLELVKQIKSNWPYAIIFAACRINSENLSAIISESNGTIHFVKTDITLEDSVKNCVKYVENIVGENGLNVLINNAAVGHKAPVIPKDSGTNSILHNIDFESKGLLFETFGTNVYGSFNVTKEFIPLLRIAANVNSSKGSCLERAVIIHISSDLGSISSADSSYMLSYRMSKAALNMMAKAVGMELSPLGISTLVIHPGWVLTDMGGPMAKLTTEDSVKGIINILKKDDYSDILNVMIDWKCDKIEW